MRGDKIRQSFHDSWRAHRTLLGVSALYILVCTAQFFLLGGGVWDYLVFVQKTLGAIATLVLVSFMVLFIGVYLRAFLRKGAPDMKTRRARAAAEYETWFSAYLEGPVFASGCFGVLACVGAAFFIIQKTTIRFVNPYAWDADFSLWDQKLHGGRHPYEWMIDHVSGLGIDSYLQSGYFYWFLLMWGSLIFNLFIDHDLKRRLQFLWVLVLSWILLGGIMATFFSSLGPAYYSFYSGAPNPYQPLLDYMTQHKDQIAGIFRVQAKLAEWQKSEMLAPSNAISAMPSMHIAIAWLVFLYAARVNRWVAAGVLAFGLWVFAGCILFGFHYAIDGYVSVILVSLMWWLAGGFLGGKDLDRPVGGTVKS